MTTNGSYLVAQDALQAAPWFWQVDKVARVLQSKAKLNAEGNRDDRHVHRRCGWRIRSFCWLAPAERPHACSHGEVRCMLIALLNKACVEKPRCADAWLCQSRSCGYQVSANRRRIVLFIRDIFRPQAPCICLKPGCEIDVDDTASYVMLDQRFESTNGNQPVPTLLPCRISSNFGEEIDSPMF